MSTPVKCNKYLIAQMCEGRREATKWGRFWYDPKRKGYCSTDLPYLESGLPLILEGCPFCFEELPSHFIHAPQLDKQKRLPPPKRSDATGYGEMDCTDGDMEG